MAAARSCLCLSRARSAAPIPHPPRRIPRMRHLLGIRWKARPNAKRRSKRTLMRGRGEQEPQRQKKKKMESEEKRERGGKSIFFRPLSISLSLTSHVAPPLLRCSAENTIDRCLSTSLCCYKCRFIVAAAREREKKRAAAPKSNNEKKKTRSLFFQHHPHRRRPPPRCSHARSASLCASPPWKPSTTLFLLPAPR